MIRIGVLTPHGVPGPEVEFAAMAPGRLATRVVRVTAEASGRPPSAAALDEITAATAAPILKRAAGQLLTGPVDVMIISASNPMVYAKVRSTSSAMRPRPPRTPSDSMPK